ncbi:MAG: hypothetical protein NTZ32_20575 [Planctomycetales bacterium]|nr:hypothetical protein [Planctomycetales bacterium]
MVACSQQQDFEEQEPFGAIASVDGETTWAAISFGQRTHSVPSEQMQLGRTPPAITDRSISPHVSAIRGSCRTRVIDPFRRD